MQYYGSQFVVAVFSDKAGADNGNRALTRLGTEGTTIYRSVVLYKNSDGRVSTVHRTEEGSKAIVFVAAFIGALAGVPTGPEAALAGAIGGALFGISAELTNRGVGNRFVQKVAYELAHNKFAICAEISSLGLASFEARMKELGATVSHRSAA
jgi:uncharacterized membrane protein